jgi:hypothetical protein
MVWSASRRIGMPHCQRPPLSGDRIQVADFVLHRIVVLVDEVVCLLRCPGQLAAVISVSLSRSRHIHNDCNKFCFQS